MRKQEKNDLAIIEVESLPERIVDKNTQTLRPISEGAEKWLYRSIKCLDHGFIYLVDYMGNDDAIVQAARVSYGTGTKKISEDRGLIRYLRRHAHTTPYEMVEFKFHCSMPIFVARQWIRHRTANVNEYSGRYSEMLDEFYLPESSVLRRQSKTNKQGRAEELTEEQKTQVLDILKKEYETQYQNYQKLLKMNVARELARIGLSVANYTQWYWKIDLHNLMHFLKLRLDSHAQHEIQVYGQAMAKIVKDAVPMAYQAFEDYVVNAITLSGPEREYIVTHEWPDNRPVLECELSWIKKQINEKFQNQRETEEFIEKLKLLKLI